MAPMTAYDDRVKRHTTIDLDVDLLREAQADLRTQGISETIHAALADVVARRRRARLAQFDFVDLTPEALEAMRSARTPAEFELIEDGLLGLPWVTSEAADWQRAREIYRALGHRPRQAQRRVKHPDLLIAAAA